MLMRVKTLALILLCASPVYAQGVGSASAPTTPVPEVQDAANEESEGKDPLSAALALTHYFSAKKASDPMTQLRALVRYKLNDQWTVYAEETLSKLYYVYEDDPELLASDGILGGSFKLPSLTSALGSTELSLGASTTLPLSISSREHDIWTVSSVSLKASQKLLDDKLAVSLTPAFAYHFNEYRSMARDDEGKFLTLYRYILEAGLTYKVSDKISLFYDVDWQKRHFEQPKRKGQNNSPSVLYSFSGGAEYQVLKDLSLGAGYVQKNRADLLGNVDINLYDEEVSLYFVNLTHVW